MPIKPENQRFIEAYQYLLDNKKIRSKRELALQLNVLPQNIYDLIPEENKNPKHKPTSKILDPLEKLFEISKSYILTGESEMLKKDVSNCEKKISELIKSGELFYASHVKSLQTDRDEILKENALLEAKVKELESLIAFSWLVLLLINILSAYYRPVFK